MANVVNAGNQRRLLICLWMKCEYLAAEPSVSVPKDGTFLDAKKALSWKNDVLMVLSGGEPKELRSKVQGSVTSSR